MRPYPVDLCIHQVGGLGCFHLNQGFGLGLELVISLAQEVPVDAFSVDREVSLKLSSKFREISDNDIYQCTLRCQDRHPVINRCLARERTDYLGFNYTFFVNEEGGWGPRYRILPGNRNIGIKQY